MTADNDPTRGNPNENPFPLPPQKDAQQRESRESIDKLVARVDKLEEDINKATHEVESLNQETKQQFEAMIRNIDNRWWLKPETAVGLALSALAITLGTFYHLTLRADSIHWGLHT